MTREEKTNIVHKWLVEAELYYDINPSDENGIEEYIERLSPKLREFYIHLRSFDIVPENSYNQFLMVLEDRFNHGRMTGIFGS